MKMLLISGIVFASCLITSALQTNAEDAVPSKGYTCEGEFFYCGKPHVVIGKGEDCVEAEDDFWEQVAEIVKEGCDQPGSVDSGNQPGIPVPKPCLCNVEPLSVKNPCYKVICTCITCDGRILTCDQTAGTIHEASRLANYRINRMLKALKTRACARSCCVLRNQPAATK